MLLLNKNMDFSQASDQILEDTETWKIIILFKNKRATYLRPHISYWHQSLTESETIALYKLEKLKKV